MSRLKLQKLFQAIYAYIVDLEPLLLVTYNKFAMLKHHALTYNNYYAAWLNNYTQDYSCYCYDCIVLLLVKIELDLAHAFMLLPLCLE